MYPYWLAQLADDTAIWSESFLSLEKMLIYIIEYSKKNYQHINSDKTKYLHLSDTPSKTPIVIDQKNTVKSVGDDGIYYLGMKMIESNDIDIQVEANLKARMGNIHNFYTWLEVNTTTPISIKLLVLYNCTLPAILYGVETWWNIDEFAEKISLIERKAIRRCLGVKQSTSNDIIYSKINKPVLISMIKDRQHMFFNKLNDLTEDEAIVKSILQLCNDSEPIKYYRNLVKDHKSICINERKVRMKDSTQTLTKRYTDLTNLEYSTTIYDSFINEELRIVLTRWRLSCTDLNTEMGRYTGLNPEERLCSFCPDYVEDEHHAIFVCRAYLGLRIQFSELLVEAPKRHFAVS